MWFFDSRDPSTTKNLAQKLGGLLDDDLVIILKGDLGAGKTTFAQGLASGLGVTEQVTSPTFVLVNQYQGRLPLCHIDAYRLRDSGEGLAAGIAEMLDSPGVVLLEWPERIEELLPGEYLQVDLVKLGNNARRLEFTALGDRAARPLEELIRACEC